MRWEYVRPSPVLGALSGFFPDRRLLLEAQPPAVEHLRGRSPATGHGRKLLGASSASMDMTVNWGEAVDHDKVSMLAHEGLMMLLTDDRGQSIGAQLMSYASPRPSTFPRHEIAEGAQFVRAAWDPHGELGFVSCWAGGGTIEDGDPAVFVCTRHSVSWFTTPTMGLAVCYALTVSMVLSTLYIICCLGRRSEFSMFLDSCRQVPLVRRLLGPPANSRENSRSSRSQRRLREVREQLAQIPSTPRRPPTTSDGEVSVDVDSGEEGPVGTREGAEHRAVADGSVVDAKLCAAKETSLRTPLETARDGGCCAICQEEVAIWVALRPCGHTACRRCTLRLVEFGHKCHICRGAIKGVQPVYL